MDYLEHCTVILASGGSDHFDGEVMYDSSEGVLVIHTIAGPRVHFNAKEYVVAWITTPITAEEEYALRQAIEDGKEGDTDA